MSNPEFFNLSGKPYTILQLLGKGKSGYSWLVDGPDGKSVIKQIHHEPVSYYSFGDKFGAELAAFWKLKNAGVFLPDLLESDEKQELIRKEFLPGPLISEDIAAGNLNDSVWKAVFELSQNLRLNGMNIDWFPTNFVWSNSRLWYLDYEWNRFESEWSFENWGIYYWLNVNGMKTFLETGDHSGINQPESGKPVTDGLENFRTQKLSTFFPNHSQV